MNSSDAGGSRHPRHLAVAVALLLASSSGGCALFSPTDQEVYVLVRVNTQSVPAVFRIGASDNDPVNEYRILRGELIITADGRWKSIDETETVVNGVASRSKSEMTGRYERDGDALVLFHSGPGFNPGDGWTAEVREGPLLVGSYSAGLLREWERR